MVMRQSLYKEENFFQEKLTWLESARLSLIAKLAEDTQPKFRKIKHIGLNQINRRLVFTAYTLGEPISIVSKHAINYVTDKVAYLEETESTLFPDGTLEQYIECLWILSFCYFFNIENDTVRKISAAIPLHGKDKIIDRLVAACTAEFIPVSDQLAFPSIYQELSSALGVYDDGPRNKLLTHFINHYYNRLKSLDVTWFDSHKEEDPNYCKHFGYWNLELATLVCDINWDDSDFEDHPMYPKELVDWKRANTLNRKTPDTR